MKQACAGKARRILKGREKLWVNPPPGGEGKALLRLAHRANRPQTLNLISGLLENATSFVLMGTTLNRVPEVIIVLCPQESIAGNAPPCLKSNSSFLSDDKASNDSAIKAAQWRFIVRGNARGIRRCGVLPHLSVWFAVKLPKPA